MTISATTRGLRPGVCTSTTRPGSPFDGQLIYETDTNRVAVYDTNTWVYKTPASTTGSVLQVVSTTKTDTFTTTSTTYTDLTGMSVTITPSSTSSRIYVISHFMGDTSGAEATNIQLVRGSTVIGNGDTAGSRTSCIAVSSTFETNRPTTNAFAYMDSPSSTSSLTYKLQIRTQSNTAFINRCQLDTDIANHPRGTSTITVMEIAG